MGTTNVLHAYVTSWYQQYTTNKGCTLLDIQRYWEKVCGSSFWLHTGIRKCLHWPRVHYVAGSPRELDWLFYTVPSFSGHLEYNPSTEDSADCVVFCWETMKRLRSFDNVHTLTVRILAPITGYRCIDSELNGCLPHNVQKVHCEAQIIFVGFQGFRWDRVPYRPQLHHVSLGQGFYPGPDFLGLKNPVQSFSLTEKCHESLDFTPVGRSLTKVFIDKATKQRPLPYCPALEEVTLRVKASFGTDATELLRKNPYIKACHIVCESTWLYPSLSKIIQDVLSPIRETVTVLSFSIRISAPQQCLGRPIEVQGHSVAHLVHPMDILTHIRTECEQTYFPHVQQITFNLDCLNGKVNGVMHGLNAIRSTETHRWSQPFPSLKLIECNAHPYMTWSDSTSENGSDSSSISVRILSGEFCRAPEQNYRVFE